MPLLVHDLSVWEVAHRWAGFDPGRFRLRLPLAVKDNCRILVDAIYNGQLSSMHLQMRKWEEADGDDMKPYFIRHHLDDIWACIAGRSFDRNFLKWAVVERWALKEFLDGHSIPLPEFWFPPAWGLEFDWTKAEALAHSETEGVGAAEQAPVDGMRASARTRIACQEIARSIWRDNPETTIADMVRNDVIRDLGGAAYFSSDAVRGWLSAIAPAEVKAKRGRPPKKPPASVGGTVAK